MTKKKLAENFVNVIVWCKICVLHTEENLCSTQRRCGANPEIYRRQKTPINLPFYIQSGAQRLPKPFNIPRRRLFQCLFCVNTIRASTVPMKFMRLWLEAKFPSIDAFGLRTTITHMQSKTDMLIHLLCHPRNQWTLCVCTQLKCGRRWCGKAQHGVPSTPSWFSLCWPQSHMHTNVYLPSVPSCAYQAQQIQKAGCSVECSGYIRFKYVSLVFAPNPFRYILVAHALARFSNYNAHTLHGHHRRISFSLFSCFLSIVCI